MYHIVAATHNPAKLQAIDQAFSAVFGADGHYIEPLSVSSGVPDQPIGSEQTLLGAHTRLQHVRTQQPIADFWLAIEAGIEDNSTFSWITIASASQYSQARSASLPLPACVIGKVQQGDSLAQAIASSKSSAINRRGSVANANQFARAGRVPLAGVDTNIYNINIGNINQDDDGQQHLPASAIGMLTNGILTRADVYQQAIILALSPFHHPLYRADCGNT